MYVRTSPSMGLHATVPLVEVTRGPVIESFHSGAFAVVDVDGNVQSSGGDVDAPVFARSSLKPVQLLAMMQLGLDLPDDLLALSAASHSGADYHRVGAQRILEMYSADTSDLRNTADLPYGVAERVDYLAQGRVPSRLAQNCSGQHAAMVATCKINGWTLDDYVDPDHPLQRSIERVVSEFMGESTAAVAPDGCGAPAFAYSLKAAARSYASFACAGAGSLPHSIFQAMRAYPEMVSGEGRDVHALMSMIPGLVAKEGAEGVQLIGLRDERIGIAVKISDGADRARLPIALTLLDRAGIDTSQVREAVKIDVQVAGRTVGERRTTPSLKSAPLAYDRKPLR